MDSADVLKASLKLASSTDQAASPIVVPLTLILHSLET